MQPKRTWQLNSLQPEMVSICAIPTDIRSLISSQTVRVSFPHRLMSLHGFRCHCLLIFCNVIIIVITFIVFIDSMPS